nr:MAG TPA: hypothetical protein [Bacteriophage sp.]
MSYFHSTNIQQKFPISKFFRYYFYYFQKNITICIFIIY